MKNLEDILNEGILSQTTKDADDAIDVDFKRMSKIIALHVHYSKSGRDKLGYYLGTGDWALTNYAGQVKLAKINKIFGSLANISYMQGWSLAEPWGEETDTNQECCELIKVQNKEEFIKNFKSIKKI